MLIMARLSTAVMVAVVLTMVIVIVVVVIIDVVVVVDIATGASFGVRFFGSSGTMMHFATKIFHVRFAASLMRRFGKTIEAVV